MRPSPSNFKIIFFFLSLHHVYVYINYIETKKKNQNPFVALPLKFLSLLKQKSLRILDFQKVDV